MNFTEAVKLMREGKKVKRKEEEHIFRCIKKDQKETYSFYIMDKWRGTDWIFCVEDFEAEDWEIVEKV